MTWTLLAYEDRYYERLHTLVKALRRDLGREGGPVEGEPVNGTGGFKNELGRQLGRLDKRTQRPAARVICVADADRPANLALARAPQRPRAPTTSELDAWVLALEREWKVQLLADARIHPAEASRVEVVCLRWSKESLLVACPDALVDFAGPEVSALRGVFARCAPDPTTAADEQFLLAYQKPGACMDDVVRAVSGRRYKKGADDEDILRDHIHPRPERRKQLLARCPDLVRLVERIL